MVTAVQDFMNTQSVWLGEAGDKSDDGGDIVSVTFKVASQYGGVSAYVMTHARWSNLWHDTSGTYHPSLRSHIMKMYRDRRGRISSCVHAMFTKYMVQLHPSIGQGNPNQYSQHPLHICLNTDIISLFTN